MVSFSELNHWSVLSTRKDVNQLHLTRPVSTPFILGVALSGINDTDGLAHIIHVHGASESVCHLNIGKTLSDATTGPNAEGAVCAGSQSDLGLGCVLTSEGVEGTHEPSLGHVLIWRGIIGLVVVDRVVRNADDSALRNDMALDSHASRENLAGEDTTDGWVHSHSFINTGAEVGARCKSGALADFLNIVELASDFFGDSLESAGASDEVEEGGGHGSGSSIGTSNDTVQILVKSFNVGAYYLQKVGFGPKLRSAESLTSFGVASLEEVVEEVATVSLLTKLGALGELTLAVCHITSTAGSEPREEDLVQVQLVDDRHGSALRPVSFRFSHGFL